MPLISKDDRLSFEKSTPGRKGFDLPKDRVYKENPSKSWPKQLRRNASPQFPELSEPDVVRHFVNLSKKNFSIDTHFYPLGSCTMKYNPKINEWAAKRSKFTFIHPLQDVETCQGFLRIFHELEEGLKALTGLERFTLQPAAGAHGELTGMMMVHAYHENRGQSHRNKVLVPDSSHGTNPASAALFGYEVVEVKSNRRGRVDIDDLKQKIDENIACLMLTNPNTLGLFEEDILEIQKCVHEKGGILYYDGANLNALLGIARPGDMGFDIVHINLHKTFSTPHGGGGPGSGPVGVSKRLVPFLPYPLVSKKGDEYGWEKAGEHSIGRLKAFHGNAGTILRAWVYLKSLGRDGLRQTSEDAILNANYLREKLKKQFKVSVDEFCMHEFVLDLSEFAAAGVHAGDVGKRLLDYGIHAPTVHFPLVVKESFMIEPTETESLSTLDHFLQTMSSIRAELDSDPELIKNAPHNLPVGRPDEVLAARRPVLTYRDLSAAKAKLGSEAAATS